MVRTKPQVSSHGRFRSVDGVVSYGTQRVDGYVNVGIHKKQYMLHKLIARAFHGKKPTPDHTVDHANRQRNDNHKDNLSYKTRSEQMQHSYSNNTTRSTNANAMSKAVEGRKDRLVVAPSRGGGGADGVRSLVGRLRSLLKDAHKRRHEGSLAFGARRRMRLSLIGIRAHPVTRSQQHVRIQRIQRRSETRAVSAVSRRDNARAMPTPFVYTVRVQASASDDDDDARARTLAAGGALEVRAGGTRWRKASSTVPPGREGAIARARA